MFCSKCGKPITPDAHFCPGCGTARSEVLSSSAPAPSVVSDHGGPTAKPLSAVKAILFTAGILVALCIVGVFIGAAASTWLMAGVVVASAIWAAVDSSRTRFWGIAFPLFVFMAMCGLWFVTFPCYLVTRGNAPAQGRKQRIAVPLAICAGLVVMISGYIWFQRSDPGVWNDAALQLAGAKPNQQQRSANSGEPTSSPRPSSTPTVQGDASVIAVVRDGILQNYNSTTVGKAFEGTFQNPKWSSFETAKGQTIIEFTGTIPLTSLPIEHKDRAGSIIVKHCADSLGFTTVQLMDATLGLDKEGKEGDKKMGACVDNVTQLSVKFQFALSVDKKRFEISYLDPLFAENYKDPLTNTSCVPFSFIYH